MVAGGCIGLVRSPVPGRREYRLANYRAAVGGRARTRPKGILPT